MSSSDPILFAARAGGMSDNELYDVFHQIRPGENPTDFQRAVLDEAQLRGILSASESGAMGGQA